MTEKRKFLRRKADLKVLCLPRQQDQKNTTEPIPFSPVTRDFSQGGVSIYTKKALPVGMKLIMVFSLDDDPEYLEMTGEVTWCREEINMALCGIRFKDPSEENVRCLEKIASYL